MQTDYVRYFVDAAKLGSIKLAAKHHFMSVQGVSRAIAALESEIGAPLFIRGNNQITLTRVGTEFLVAAEHIIEAEDSAKKVIRQACGQDEDRANQILYAYCSSIAFDTPLFYPVADASRGLFGKVRFSQCSNEGVVQALIDANDNSDAAAVSFGLVSAFDLFPKENANMIRTLKLAGYDYMPVIKCEDLVLVSQSSPLAHKSVLTRSDVLSEPLSISQGDMGKAVHKKFGDAGIFLSTYDSAFRMRLVQRGECNTFIPALAAAYGIPDGTLAVPMEDPYSVEVGFVARPDLLKSRIVEEIVRRIIIRYGGQHASGGIKLLVSHPQEVVAAPHGGLPRGSFTSEVIERYGLSEREAEILSLMSANTPVPDISLKLGVSIATARTHVQHIYKKCGVHSREELMSVVFAGVM